MGGVRRDERVGERLSEVVVAVVVVVARLLRARVYAGRGGGGAWVIARMQR